MEGHIELFVTNGKYIKKYITKFTSVATKEQISLLKIHFARYFCFVYKKKTLLRLSVMFISND